MNLASTVGIRCPVAIGSTLYYLSWDASDGRIRKHDLVSDVPLGDLVPPQSGSYALSLHKLPGNRLVYARSQRQIVVLDTAGSEQLLITVPSIGGFPSIGGLVPSQDGRSVWVIDSNDGVLRRYSLETGAELEVIDRADDGPDDDSSYYELAAPAWSGSNPPPEF